MLFSFLKTKSSAHVPYINNKNGKTNNIMYQHPRIAFQLADRKIANLKSSQTTKQQFTFFFHRTQR